MAGRAACGGRGAVRWAYGVLLTLCVALAVLVHHETSVVSASPSTPHPTVRGAHAMSEGAAPFVSCPVRAVHAMWEGAAPFMPRLAHAAPAMSHGAAPSVEDAFSHQAHDDGCAMSGMQHCGAAGVGSVHLVPPGRSAADVITPPSPAGEGRASAAAVGRAPPDLSVLSHLRM